MLKSLACVKKNNFEITPKETTPNLQIANGDRDVGKIFDELHTMGPADRIKAYHSLGNDLRSIQENLLTTISPSSINDENRPEIGSYIEFQSKISAYFTDKITDQKTPQDQENAIKFCIDLATYCKKNNDLMGAQAIFLAINQKQVWNLKNEAGQSIFDNVKQDSQYGAKMKNLDILINMQASRGLMSELKASGESFIPLIPGITNKVINSKENLPRFMANDGQDQYNFQGVHQNRELIKSYFPSDVRQSPEPRTLQTNLLDQVSTHAKQGSLEELHGALEAYKKAVEHHETTPFSFEYLPAVPNFQPVKDLFLKADKSVKEEFLKSLDPSLLEKLNPLPA